MRVRLRAVLTVLAVLAGPRVLPALALPALAAVLALTVTACGGSASPGGVAAAGESGDRLEVVATTTQVADFARNIGGTKVKVTQILKPNVDPHDYEPSPADLLAFSKADVVVKNGVGLEAWLDNVVSSAGFEGTTIDASRGVAVRPADDPAEKAGDPHIWHNPKNAEIMVRNIAAGFGAADAADRAYYESNLGAYAAELNRLDTWIARQYDAVPPDRRKLVTNHDAFRYYVDRYRLTFVGSIIPSFDTSAELSASSIAELVAKIKSTGVKAVFSEASLPPKSAAAIGQQAGVRVVAGEDSLYGDTLGPPGSAGATYVGMERHNTTTIVTALEG